MFLMFLHVTVLTHMVSSSMHISTLEASIYTQCWAPRHPANIFSEMRSLSGREPWRGLFLNAMLLNCIVIPKTSTNHGGAAILSVTDDDALIRLQI